MSLYDYIAQRHISIDKFDRPGTIRPRTTKIVMHYTGNPGATDEGHYSFYQNVNTSYASAHIFIDKDSGLEFIPLNEVAYHASNANSYAIGIELCQERDGTFHPDTIARAIKVVGELCKMFNLDPLLDVIRHFDVTGKNCPAPWVSKPELYIKFKEDVKTFINPVEHPLDIHVADFVIAVMKQYYASMEGNPDVQNYTHQCANVIRRLAGIEEE